MGMFMFCAQNPALPARRLCATTGLEALEELYKLELANNFAVCLDHVSTHGFSLILGETCRSTQLESRLKQLSHLHMRDHMLADIKASRHCA